MYIVCLFYIENDTNMCHLCCLQMSIIDGVDEVDYDQHPWKILV